MVDSNPGSPQFFWLNGIAGIGKTTIARTVAQLMAKSGRLGASFFFSRTGEAELRDASVVFTTLAYHLSRFDQELGSLIAHALGRDPDAVHDGLKLQLNKLIVAPVGRASSQREPVVIVLDALDECEGQGARELLRLLLAEVPKLAFPLKIFVSSRPEPHIRNCFNQPETHRRVILHHADAAVIKSDIRLYLRISFDRIAEEAEPPLPKTWVRSDEIEALVERTGQLFIIVATACRFIGDDKASDPRRHLDAILYRSDPIVGRTYQPIDEIYLQVLRSTQSAAVGPHILERFRKTIGTIVVLQDPLALTAIERLVGLPVNDGRRALHHLHSVISTQESKDDSPHVHHPSFIDFITDDTRCTEPEFFIDVQNHELRLATCCLDFMLSNLTGGLADGFKSHLNDEVAELRDNLQNGLAPEMKYACRQWASHILKTEKVDQCLMAKLSDFLKQSFLRWLEVMSVLGDIGLAETCVRNAQEWCVTVSCHTDRHGGSRVLSLTNNHV